MRRGLEERRDDHIFLWSAASLPALHTSYQSPVPVTIYRLPITSYRLPITNYQLSVTSYQLPVAGYQSPITNLYLGIT